MMNYPHSNDIPPIRCEVISTTLNWDRNPLSLGSLPQTHGSSLPTHTPVKDKLETLVLVRGITVFTVRVVGVLIVGLLTRLAVLATWATERQKTD